VLALTGFGALGVLSGCTGSDDHGSGGGTGEPDPDLALLARAVADTQDLLATYDRALDAQPALAPRVRPLREDHAAHLAALTGFRPDLPTPGPSASAAPSSTPTPDVPGDRDKALELLARADFAAAGRRIGQCRSARDPQLARLLASIGGSEAAHAAVLRAGSS
jgi:hypothetical protein